MYYKISSFLWNRGLNFTKVFGRIKKIFVRWFYFIFCFLLSFPDDMINFCTSRWNVERFFWIFFSNQSSIVENWTLKLRYCILYKLISIIKKKIDSEYVDTLKNSKNSSDKINNNFDNIFIVRARNVNNSCSTNDKMRNCFLAIFFFFSKKQNFQFPNTKPFTAINFALKIIRKLDWQDWMLNEW